MPSLLHVNTCTIHAWHKREISTTHAAHELTTCNVFANEKKCLQKLVKHHYNDRRTKILVKLKALLETDRSSSAGDGP